jgi:hypothetical protein
VFIIKVTMSKSTESIANTVSGKGAGQPPRTIDPVNTTSFTNHPANQHDEIRVFGPRDSYANPEWSPQYFGPQSTRQYAAYSVPLPPPQSALFEFWEDHEKEDFIEVKNKRMTVKLTLVGILLTRDF